MYGFSCTVYFFFSLRFKESELEAQPILGAVVTSLASEGRTALPAVGPLFKSHTVVPQFSATFYISHLETTLRKGYRQSSHTHKHTHTHTQTDTQQLLHIEETTIKRFSH